MDDLPRRIDHTVLGPETTPDDVDRAVETALELGTNACVPPCYVERARERLDDAGGAASDALADGTADVRTERATDETTDAPAGSQLVTVVGFPHGQHDPAATVEEAVLAERAGADELDVVANVGRLHAGEDDRVRDALSAVVEAVDVPVKAIVEAPLLDRPELERACEAAAAAGCSHVKTASGFNSETGATVEDVAVMAEFLPVKASGGIGSWDAARELLAAGATRIGASSGDVIVREWREAAG